MVYNGWFIMISGKGWILNGIETLWLPFSLFFEIHNDHFFSMILMIIWMKKNGAFHGQNGLPHSWMVFISFEKTRWDDENSGVAA